MTSTMASTHPSEQNGKNGTDLSVPINQPRPILIIVMVRACPDVLRTLAHYGTYVVVTGPSFMVSDRIAISIRLQPIYRAPSKVIETDS